MKTTIKTEFNFDLLAIKRGLKYDLVSYFTHNTNNSVFGDYIVCEEGYDNNIYSHLKNNGNDIVQALVDDMFTDIDTLNHILTCYFKNSLCNQHYQSYGQNSHNTIDEILNEDVLKKYKDHIINIITLVDEVVRLDYEKESQRIIKNIEDLDNETKYNIENHSYPTQ